MSIVQKPNTKIDFVPKIFRSKFCDWMGLTGLMLLGAIIGLLISIFLPTIYEARSKLTTNLEVVTGTNVSEIMVDAQVDIVGTLIFHPDVVEQTIKKLETRGLTYTYSELIHKTRIERQLMSNIIKVRDHEPEKAAWIATAWAESAYERLSEAYPHALALTEAKASQMMLKSCLSDIEKQSLPFCQSLSVDEAQQIISETENIILRESPLSLGLTGELNVSQYQPAPVPEYPVAFHRPILMLAGALAGLVTALVIGEIEMKESERE
jgi:hypothetical protein